MLVPDCSNSALILLVDTAIGYQLICVSDHQHLFVMLKLVRFKTWLATSFHICWTPDSSEEITTVRFYSKMLYLYPWSKENEALHHIFHLKPQTHTVGVILYSTIMCLLPWHLTHCQAQIGFLKRQTYHFELTFQRGVI